MSPQLIVLPKNHPRSVLFWLLVLIAYHLHADNPLLLKICRHISIEAQKRGWKAIDYLCIIVHWKYALSRRLVSNFGCLSIKIVKLAFHVLDMDFCVCVSATVIDCYLKITQGAFCFDCLSRAHYGSCFLSILFFLKLKTQNFRDDALLVQEICSFIHFIFNKWF